MGGDRERGWREGKWREGWMSTAAAHYVVSVNTLCMALHRQAHRSAWTQVGVCADLPWHEVFAECLRRRFL